MIRSWWRWRQRCRWWWGGWGWGEHFTDQFSKRGVHLEIDDRTVLRNDDPVVATGGTRRLHVPVEGVLKVRVLHPSLVHRIAASCKYIPRPWAIFKNIHQGGHVTSMDHFREHSQGRSRHVHGSFSRKFTREVKSRSRTIFKNIHQGGHVTSLDHSQEHSPGRPYRTRNHEIESAIGHSIDLGSFLIEWRNVREWMGGSCLCEWIVMEEWEHVLLVQCFIV